MTSNGDPNICDTREPAKIALGWFDDFWMYSLLYVSKDTSGGMKISVVASSAATWDFSAERARTILDLIAMHGNESKRLYTSNVVINYSHV